VANIAEMIKDNIELFLVFILITVVISFYVIGISMKKSFDKPLSFAAIQASTAPFTGYSNITVKGADIIQAAKKFATSKYTFFIRDKIKASPVLFEFTPRADGVTCKSFNWSLANIDPNSVSLTNISYPIYCATTLDNMQDQTNPTYVLPNGNYSSVMAYNTAGEAVGLVFDRTQ
jgi:hypothetical protein